MVKTLCHQMPRENETKEEALPCDAIIQKLVVQQRAQKRMAFFCNSHRILKKS